jgi:hypothetical protein
MRSTILSIGARAGSARFKSYKAPKVGTLKLLTSLHLTKIAKSQNSPLYWLVGHFWGCSGQFHEMVILQLLFSIKFPITLFKGTPPCKISKLDFLNSQIKTLYRSKPSQHHLGGQFSHFGQHEHCSTNHPKCS